MSSDQENLNPEELNYRDQDDEYDSSEDEDYVPTGEEEQDDYDDEEDAEYVDEGDSAEPDEASRVLDELVEMFVSNTGRAPTEEEMQEWIETMKTLVVSEGGGESTGEGAAEAESIPPSASE